MISRWTSHIRFLSLSAGLSIAAALFAGRDQTRAPAQEKAESAVGVQCLKCHSPIQAALSKKVRHAAVEMGCESCHVNHRDKNASGGSKESHYLSDKEPAVCGGCHDLADKKLGESHKGQPFATAECSGCHDPHASDKAKLMGEHAHAPFDARECESCHKPPKDGKAALTEASISELCYGCHADAQEKLKGAKSKHTLLTSDANSCTDCHDPHASRYRKALKQTGAALCEGCHPDVTGEKKFAHRPAKDDCGLCHDAHGSEHPRQLHAPVEALCLECHNATALKKFTAAAPVELFGGKATLPARPYPGLKMLTLAGGKTGHPIMNHPVSAPGKDGKPGFDCVTCHKPHAADGGPLLLTTETATTSELCVRCHK